jgi:dynactin-5
MDMPVRNVTSNEYRKTQQYNLKISRKFFALGQHQVSLASKNTVEHGVILRGDLAKIKIGDYTIFDQDCIIRPSLSAANPPFEYKEINIGKCCYIGKNTIISAFNIGDHVFIGENCIIVYK